MTIDFFSIPKDIFILIADYLQEKDILSLSSTCKTINTIITDRFHQYTVVLHKRNKNLILVIESRHPLYQRVFQKNMMEGSIKDHMRNSKTILKLTF